jgi:ligand-binding SRPBCC domain-containing protein
MKDSVFVKTSPIAARARDVFQWHLTPDALKKLIPSWEPVVVEKAPDSLADGQIAVLLLSAGPLKLRWVAIHRDFQDRGDDGGAFTDQQVTGPFASWVHRHLVTATGPATCILEDRIEYRLKMGRVGQLLAGWYVRRKLRRMFDYRHEVTRRELEGRGVY